MNCPSSVSYKSTAIACYIGNFVQAIVINLAPILFIPLRVLYGLSYTQLGLLVLINFSTQVAVDILLSGLADKHGFRGLCVLGQVLAILGLGLFALTPFIFSNLYFGFVISTIIFSGGGGLMEMLLSPIVDSIPTDVKATAMSVLHSFYAWGQLSVIVITTLFLFLFGISSWPIITALWLIVPIANAILFSVVPLCPPISKAERTKLKDFLKHPYFLIALFAILLGGASEVGMAQWASAFLEKGLDLPKIFGDLVGVAMFALMLGIGRAIFGKYGKQINMNNILILGSALAIVCYFLVAVSLNPIIPVIFSGICGIAVSLLWPGSLVLVSEKFPKAGARIFALMAAGGDIGAAVGPWLISYITDSAFEWQLTQELSSSIGLTGEQIALRFGMLTGIMFPFLCLLCHIYLKKYKSSNM
jgi:MFS family permease